MTVFGANQFLDSNHCDSHLINRGLTVFPNETVLVEFEPTGPSAEDPFSSSEYICSIDYGTFYPCKFSSL